MLLSVVLVGILARHLNKRELIAVYADIISGKHSLALSAAETGVYLDSESSELLPDILAVKGKGIVVINKE